MDVHAIHVRFKLVSSMMPLPWATEKKPKLEVGQTHNKKTKNKNKKKCVDGRFQELMSLSGVFVHIL